MVAAYLATDGELSPGPCVKLLRGCGATLVFPRIADDAMTFHVVGHDDELIPGNWGLMQPASTAGSVDAAAIDVVLTPLVAFDDRCERMGRGKAYYDRCFGFLSGIERPARPVLVGLAHDCQRVEALDHKPHDVRLDAVVTPSGIVGTLPS
jgi:5-formyltetrahydrofolate cyclo-ligase